jgi:hypothetical protein
MAMEKRGGYQPHKISTGDQWERCTAGYQPKVPDQQMSGDLTPPSGGSAVQPPQSSSNQQQSDTKK